MASQPEARYFAMLIRHKIEFKRLGRRPIECNKVILGNAPESKRLRRIDVWLGATQLACNPGDRCLSRS